MLFTMLHRRGTGGDVTEGNGMGVKSIYNNGSNFNDENFVLKNFIGWLGMANAGTLVDFMSQVIEFFDEQSK